MRGFLVLAWVVALPHVFSEREKQPEVMGPELLALAKAQALDILSTIVPAETGKQSKSEQVKGHYVLWGELFEKNRVVAVVELFGDKNAPVGMGFAAWQEGKWEVQDAFGILPLWKSETVPKDEIQFLPKGLPEKPFWTQSLWPDRPPMLVVSVDHCRYRGGHRLLRFDELSHRLVGPSHFTVGKPEMRGRWLVLSNDSGRKAWWGEESFYELDQNNLVFRGSLRTGSYNGDDSHVSVTFVDSQTRSVKKWRFVRASEEGPAYSIFLGDDTDPTSSKVGEFRFDPASTSNGIDCESYLFERLTGLPAVLSKPDSWSEGKLKQPQRVFAPSASVEVSGPPDVVNYLTQRKQPSK